MRIYTYRGMLGWTQRLADVQLLTQPNYMLSSDWLMSVMVHIRVNQLLRSRFHFIH